MVDRPWENDELQEFFSSSILNGTWIKLCSDIKYQGHEKSNAEFSNNKYYIAIRKTAIVDDLSTTPCSFRWAQHLLLFCFYLIFAWLVAGYFSWSSLSLLIHIPTFVLKCIWLDFRACVGCDKTTTVRTAAFPIHYELIECSRTIWAGRRATREFSFQLLKPEAPQSALNANCAPSQRAYLRLTVGRKRTEAPLAFVHCNSRDVYFFLETTIGEDRVERNFPCSEPCRALRRSATWPAILGKVFDAVNITIKI